MRTMWMAMAAMMVGCGSSADRSLTGELPAEATGVYAMDASGAKTQGTVDGSAFAIALAPGAVRVVVDVDGVPYELRFPSTAGGAADHTNIPDFTGEVALGVLTLHSAGMRAATGGDDWAESEENPLAQVDSDDDGEDDLADEDDDDDGVDDVDDEDDDGDGEDDDDDGEDETETETETD